MEKCNVSCCSRRDSFKTPPGWTFFFALTIRLSKTCSMRALSVSTYTLCSGSSYCNVKLASGTSINSRPATVSRNSTKSNRSGVSWAAPVSNADKSNNVVISPLIRSVSVMMISEYFCFLASSVSSCKPSA